MKEILFLKRFIIGNEIWILYQNVHRKRIWFKDNRSSIVVKPTRRKFFLFIWWDWNSTEFFSQDKTINFGKYYNQLDKLKDAIAEKRSKLVNRRGHDNAKLHWLREKLLQFDWDILSHLLYFPDLALSDYYVSIIKKILSMINDSNP